MCYYYWGDKRDLVNHNNNYYATCTICMFSRNLFISQSIIFCDIYVILCIYLSILCLYVYTQVIMEHMHV